MTLNMSLLLPCRLSTRLLMAAMMLAMLLSLPLLQGNSLNGMEQIGLMQQLLEEQLYLTLLLPALLLVSFGTNQTRVRLLFIMTHSELKLAELLLMIKSLAQYRQKEISLLEQHLKQLVV